MFKRLFAALIVLSILVGSPLTAQTPKAQADYDYQQRSVNFNVLENEAYCSLSTTQNVTPADITSTNSYTLAYCPATITEFPLKVVVQNLGTNKIYVTKYSTSSGGLHTTTATCSFLMDPGQATNTPQVGDEVEMIFFDTPALTFGGGGSAATFTIRVYTREDDPYQP